MQLRAIKRVSRSKEWIFSFTFTQFHIKQRITTTIRVEEFLQWKVVVEYRAIQRVSEKEILIAKEGDNQLE